MRKTNIFTLFFAILINFVYFYAMILPTPEIRLYGDERYEQGYTAGYLKRTHLMRRLKSLKEKSLYKQFGVFYDYLDDNISKNRKK